MEPAAEPGGVPASAAAGDQCHTGIEVSTTLQLALLGTAWKRALWKVPRTMQGLVCAALRGAAEFNL